MLTSTFAAVSKFGLLLLLFSFSFQLEIIEVNMTYKYYRIIYLFLSSLPNFTLPLIQCLWPSLKKEVNAKSINSLQILMRTDLTILINDIRVTDMRQKLEQGLDK